MANNIKILQDLLERRDALDPSECLRAAKLLEQMRDDLVSSYRTGIITALPHEMAAVEATFDGIELMRFRNVAFKVASAAKRDSNAEGIIVIVKQAVDYGNNMAALCANEMLLCFPHMDSIIMVGIAGGIPDPKNCAKHVRLGDIVVSGAEGVAQYDFGKQEGEEFVERSRGRPPSAKLLDVVNEVKNRESIGQTPWDDIIDVLCGRLGWACPPEDTDVLVDSDTGKAIPHPQDSSRRAGRPRVFHGKIGSANIVLKSAQHRAAVRDKYGVLAVEMEASGVADATWRHQSGYLVVRGVCDYADERKNDAWQRYAAITAAAYCRNLLEI